MTLKPTEQDVAAALRTLVPPPPAAPALFEQVGRRARRRTVARRAMGGLATVAVLVGAAGVAMERPSDTGVVAASTGPAHCPAEKPSHVEPPARSDARKTLVPGHPEVVTVCRFTGTVRRIVVRDGVAELAAALNQGTPIGNSVADCPADDGRADLLVFGYPAGRPVRVLVSRSGCGIASNGEFASYTTEGIQQWLEEVGA